MAKPPKAFDVWFLTANTVYKAVPYNVVADWTQLGRLAASDMVRPAGTEVAWQKLGDSEFLADYLPQPQSGKAVLASENEVAPATTNAGAVPASTTPPAGVAIDELPDPEAMKFRSRPAEEDNDVDMIPLIDISMVLLVFFIMIKAEGALAPVDVPEMRYAGQLSADPDAITITIDQLNRDEVFYSVRVGPTAPKPEHNSLRTPEDAIRALDELLATAQRPPEVRIACRKELPRERVYELRRELEGRQKKNYINSFTATVVEAPEK